jgi:uncharacterized protein YqhQ
MKISLNFLLIISCFLYLFDFSVTCWLIQNFGVDIELNPILHRFFQISPAFVLLFKFGVFVLYLYIVSQAAQKNFYFAYRGAQIVCALLGLVGIFHYYNLYLIFIYS